MEFSHLSSLLGARADDERLIALLDSHGIQRRPEAPDFFKSPYEVSFFISKLGLMLYFQDDAYVRNQSPRQWGKSHLVLRSVIACSGIEGQVRPYAGSLPFGIEWSDTRADVRRRLEAGAGELHPGWRDCWWQGERYTVVNYLPGDFGEPEVPGVFEVIQGLFLPSMPAPLPEASYPDVQTLLSLMGMSVHSPAFLAAFADFDLASWEIDEHIDLRRRFGIEFYLDPQKPAQDGKPSLGGVNLLRDRLGPSTGWQGALPLQMNFDMAFEDLIQLVGRQPDEAQLDMGVWGWAKWFFEDHVLWINFDSMRNRLESVALMARGYARPA